MNKLSFSAVEGELEQSVKGEHYVTTVFLNEKSKKKVVLQTRSLVYEIHDRRDIAVENEFGVVIGKVQVDAHALVTPPVVSDYRIGEGDWERFTINTAAEIVVAASKVHNAIPLFDGFEEKWDLGCFDGTPADYLRSERSDLRASAFESDGKFLLLGGVTVVDISDPDGIEHTLSHKESIELGFKIVDKKADDLGIYKNDNEVEMSFDVADLDAQPVALKPEIVQSTKKAVAAALTGIPKKENTSPIH